MLNKLQNVHPLAWATAFAAVVVTVWSQVSPSILPLIPAHAAQIVTAFVALCAAFSPSKKQP